MSKLQAVKKLYIAIGKILDVVDSGFGCNDTQKALDSIRNLIYEIENDNQ